MVFKLADKKPSRGPAGFAISLCAHALFFLWVVGPAWPSKTASVYDQAIRPQETHLIWYNFKQRLPDVSPPNKDVRKKPLLARTLAEQSIVSAPKDAPEAKQMIFHPVPELKPEPPKPLPNMIALSLPPPPQRQFTPPKPVQAARAAVKAADMTEAPSLEAKVEAPDFYKMPKVAKPFVRPAERPAKLTLKVQTVDAPELTPGAASATAAAAKALDQGSRVMAFRPQQKASITASVGAMPDAPVLEGATAATANVAVVGLNPIDTLQRPVTESSRKAQFSAGPKVNLDGATSSGTSSGITVPDLTIRGGEHAHGTDPNAAATLLARAMPPSMPSAAAVREAMNQQGRTLSGSEMARAAGAGIPHNGIPVSGAPDPKFEGRQVFSMAIQSPNLTSHQGSWLMWYADRALLSNRATISSPQAMHKVDPKYIATAAEERVEGSVRLAFVIGHDGKVYDVQVVKGIDPRLDHSAVEALQKWVFEPAAREGKPIDVDAVVEIPFRLAPRETP